MEKPKGIKVISGLLIMWGLVLVLLTAAGTSDQNGISFAYLLIGSISASIMLIGAIGLLKGKKWAWWLQIVFFQAVIYGALMLCILYILGIAEESVLTGVSSIVIFGGVVIYLYKKNTMDFYQIELEKRKKAFIISISISTLITLKNVISYFI